MNKDIEKLSSTNRQRKGDGWKVGTFATFHFYISYFYSSI